MAKKKKIKTDKVLPRLPLDVLEKIQRMSRVESKRQYDRKSDRKKFKNYLNGDE